jgi:RimJ/RimL family protein N-acetyltransferase
MSKRPVPVTLRAVTTEDREQLSAWYHDDQEGLEQFFGVELPSEQEYVTQFNRLFEQMQQYTARMLMAELKQDLIGFVMVTDVPPTLEVGRVHIYLTPKKRRYVLRAVKAGIAEAEKMGIQVLIQTVRASNTAAIKLSKKVGFLPSPVMTLIKELR